MKEIHMEVFKYLRPIIEKSLEEEEVKKNIQNIKNKEDVVVDDDITKDDDENKNNEAEKKEAEKNEEVKYKELSDEAFFEKLFPNLTETNWKEEFASNTKYPYELKLLRTADRWYGKKCYYCDEVDCDDCYVPYNETKVQELLDRTENPKSKNDYYYYEHTYYNNDSKKQLELEVIFKDDSWIRMNYLEMIELSKDYHANTKESRVNIYDCLEQFSKWENLDENNLWYWPTCKDSVAASKKIEIFKAPPILILHLKRFKIKNTISIGRTGERLSTLVDFPLTSLNLIKYVYDKSAPAIYDLYAVSNHYGSTGFGHYTAFALNKGIWRKFDDSSVSTIDPSQVCSTAAYVLFYKRQDITDDIDLGKLRQTIPDGYKVPIIEVKSKETKKEETKKEETTPNANNIEMQTIRSNKQEAGEELKEQSQASTLPNGDEEKKEVNNSNINNIIQQSNQKDDKNNDNQESNQAKTEEKQESSEDLSADIKIQDNSS